MKKIILSIIAAVCCLTASADTTPATEIIGNKTFYKIGTLDELTWFANHVNVGNTTVNAILTADITMNEGVLDSSGNLSSGTFENWTPIGGLNEQNFTGEFNGNGHTISGLYFNSDSRNNVGIFGKAGGNAYIHDLGISDSYFYGLDHVGGICGDFASGRIENCWNGAYVMAYDYDAGGISGSCYVNASIANCYNIGIVSTYESKVGAQGVTQNEKFGGICGSVYNSSATYSIDNCYTLKSRSIPQGGDPYNGLPHVSGDCDKIYGFLVDNCPASKIHDSYVKNAEAFVGGEVCYRLNRGVTNGSQKWYQTLGDDPSPVLNNIRGTVYHGYDGDVLKYSNTTLTIPTTKHEQCAATCNARGYSQDCWEDNNSGKIYAEAACLHELNPAAVISYIPSADDPTYLINQGVITGWTQEVNQTYDGVNFGYAAVKVFEDNSDNTDNYGSDEWVSFLVKEANAKNARLKWSLTGDKNKKYNGCYGTYTLTYKVGDNEQAIPLSTTQFETSSEVYVLNLGNLSQNSVIEFHIKDYINSCSTPNEVTWAVTLEYVSEHSPQHVDAMAATCTEKGNYENWYCKKCDKHFANAECTTVMNDWEIPALEHDFTYTPYRTSTCTSEGDVEHWHCNRCEKDFNTGEQMASEDHVISGSLKIPCKESDAIVVGMDNGKIYDDCHTFTPPTEGEGETLITTVTFDGDAVKMKVKNGEETAYSLNENKPLETFFAHTFKLEANQDPDHPTNFYSTFFTSERAYKLPAETATAYAGTVDNEQLKMTDIGGIIHKGEPVVLKSTDKSIVLLPSAITATATESNNLIGTEEGLTSAPENSYALSLGQNGVGFYLWSGKSIGKNKAYLIWDGSKTGAKAFTFKFDDEADGIRPVNDSSTGSETGDNMYNLNGVRVNGNYKGIVIKNGKKVYRK